LYLKINKSPDAEMCAREALELLGDEKGGGADRLRITLYKILNAALK
jgi:hypothetical protein